MMMPCAFLQFESIVGDGPTVELELLSEFVFEFDDDEGEDADAVLVAEVEDEDERNGFESDDRDAAERSNVNCRMLSGPC
jgi:hypothetical protein